MSFKLKTLTSVNRPKLDLKGYARGKLVSIAPSATRDDRIQFDLEVVGNRGTIPPGGTDSSFLTGAYIDSVQSPDGSFNIFSTVLLNWSLMTEKELRVGSWKEEEVLAKLKGMIGKDFSFKYKATYLEENLNGKLVPIQSKEDAKRKDKVRVGHSIMVPTIVPVAG